MFTGCTDESVTLNVWDSFTFKTPNYPSDYVDDDLCTKDIVVSRRFITKDWTIPRN